MKDNSARHLTITLFAVYLLLLISIIMFKLPFYSGAADERAVNLIPLKGSFDENGVLVLREIIYNILLFVPLGMYISMLKGGWTLLKKSIPIIGLTIAFEALQFVFVLGRSDVTDVLSNTVGGLIGICVYTVLLRLFKGRTARIVSVAALVVTVCVAARFAQLFYLSHYVMRPPSR